MKDFKQKSFDLAKHLGFEIKIEGNQVFLTSEDIKSEFMKFDYADIEETWWSIWRNLKRWGDGCNLIQTVG